MDFVVRASLGVIAAVQAVLAVAFVFQVEVATDLWPFPGRTPLTNIFIGSIFAAAAASTAWCLVNRSDRGFAGIALDYLMILAPFTVFTFAQVAGGAEPGDHLVAFGLACVAGLAVGLALLAWSLRHRWRDPRPTPAPVRVSFGFFVVALILVAGLLIAGVPNIIPWQITPELSVLIGIMFLGASAYFAYGVVEPRWENAGGQLAGFLAYDVVLVIPIVSRLPTVDDALRLNLVVYTGVVAFSGLLAINYLFVNPATRTRWLPGSSIREPGGVDTAAAPVPPGGRTG
jgi:hypothetical protein